MDIKAIVERSDTKISQAFDWFVQTLILLSIVTFSIETLPDLSSTTRQALRIIEIVIVILFTIEYLLRLYVADRKMGYVLSFYGFIDLVAILPFYIGLGVDLKSIRIIRILRVFRLLKLLKYNNALSRFLKALVISKEELVLFGMGTMFMLYISAVGIYYCENEAQPEVFKSIFHSLWWAVITLTTVGYGDMAPVTLGGRLFTFFILMIGLAIVAVPTGLLASALSKVRMEEQEEEKNKNNE